MQRDTQIGPRSLLRAVGSLWFAAVLLVLVLVVMACATVFESTHGTEQALSGFYHSIWFEILLGLVCVNALAALAVRFPFSRRQTGFVLTHVSILVTFTGALVIKHFGIDGQVGIVEGQTVDHFGIRRDVLVVASRGDGRLDTLDVTPAVGGRFEPTDLGGGYGLTLGDLSVDVVRYVPDSEWTERVVDDSPFPSPAVEVALSRRGQGEPGWVFEETPAMNGGAEVSYRQVQDRDDLARLVDAAIAGPSESKGAVRIVVGGTAYEIALEDCQQSPVPLGDTGYTVRVLRYLPHAVLGADNAIVNASNQPMNPYVEAELVGPNGVETRRAFARYPDFKAMHGTDGEAGPSLVFVAGDSAITPVEVLSGPGGELYVRFAPEGGDIVVRKLALDMPVETPWPGRQFVVLRRFDHARVQRELVAVDPVRKSRVPAILLRLHCEGRSSEQWLQKHRSIQVGTGNAGFDLGYGDQKAPLGFSVTLDRFRIGYYPGGQRPRSFESRITLADPGGGRTRSQVVSMNHPVKFGGYTFYQSSYRMEDGRLASILGVARDPGLPIVFAGYIGLMAGMVIVLGIRMADQKRAARSPHADTASPPGASEQDE